MSWWDRGLLFVSLVVIGTVLGAIVCIGRTTPWDIGFRGSPEASPQAGFAQQEEQRKAEEAAAEEEVAREEKYWDAALSSTYLIYHDYTMMIRSFLKPEESIPESQIIELEYVEILGVRISRNCVATVAHWNEDIPKGRENDVMLRGKRDYPDESIYVLTPLIVKEEWDLSILRGNFPAQSFQPPPIIDLHEVSALDEYLWRIMNSNVHSELPISATTPIVDEKYDPLLAEIDARRPPFFFFDGLFYAMLGDSGGGIWATGIEGRPSSLVGLVSAIFLGVPYELYIGPQPPLFTGIAVEASYISRLLAELPPGACE